jgi:hypothetical protein
MGSRIVPYNKEDKCDHCGNIGAYDFMGDTICHLCWKTLMEEADARNADDDE